MFDIRSFCQDHSIPIIDGGHHHSHQGWLQIHCPFCTNGTYGWHLGFNTDKGNFNCWRCGSHKVWDVLIQLLGSKEEAYKTLQKYQTESIRQIKAPSPRKKTLWKPPGLCPMSSQHKKYLSNRGFDPERLEEEWDLRGTQHLSGEWNWRIVFPICDKDGSPEAYCGRSIGKDVKPKYKMSDNEDILVNPKQLLYGIQHAQDFVMIVEGPTDVWRLGYGAVATLGIDWKSEQANILKQFPRRFVMYDPEPEAQRQAHKLADWLSVYKGSTEVISDLTTDPGGLPFREANQIMEEIRNGG